MGRTRRLESDLGNRTWEGAVSKPPQSERWATKNMDAETLRYLLAALIQVFGTLVAVDAIFLIFYHHNLVFRKSPLLFQLGRYVIMATKLKRIREIGSDAYRQDVIEKEASAFEAQNPADIDKQLKEAQDWISDQIHKLDHGLTHGHEEHWDESAAKRNLNDLRKHHSIFDYYLQQYRTIQHKLERMPRLVVKTMVVPACFVIVFSIALCPVGRMGETQNLLVGTLAVVASFLGLWFLISKAYSVIKE